MSPCERTQLATALLVGGFIAACTPTATETSTETGSPSAIAPPTGVTPPIPSAPDDLFEDVTEQAGIAFERQGPHGTMGTILEAVGSGAAWLDHDGDGDLDLYLLEQGWLDGVSTGPEPDTQPGNRLYSNRGDGTFEDVTDAAGVGDTGFGFSAAAADYDNDGDVDLYVLNAGPNRLYRNRGDGTFEDATQSAGVGGSSCSVAGTFLDHDGDGLLDLYVGNYLTFDPSYRLHYAPDAFPGPLAFAAQPDILYRNQGDGTFVDVSAQSGIAAVAGRAMGVVATDLTGDGITDVFVANDATANFLFRNLGDGRFEEIALSAGLAYGISGEATAAMAGAIGDYDGDGRPDVHVTDSSYGALYRNQRDGFFVDRTLAAGVASSSGQWVSWGSGFLDHDDDGHLDLLLVNGDMHHPTGRPDLLLRGLGDGTFEDVSAQCGAYFHTSLLSRGAAIADYDDDGDLDVLVTTVLDRPVLLRNRGTPGNHSLTLAVTGRRDNRDGLGARVTIHVAGGVHTQTVHAPAGYLTQADPRLHFGLGSTDSVDLIEVTWPDGTIQRSGPLAADRVYRIVQGEEIQ